MSFSEISRNLLNNFSSFVFSPNRRVRETSFGLFEIRRSMIFPIKKFQTVFFKKYCSIKCPFRNYLETYSTVFLILFLPHRRVWEISLVYSTLERSDFFPIKKFRTIFFLEQNTAGKVCPFRKYLETYSMIIPRWFSVPQKNPGDLFWDIPDWKF